MARWKILISDGLSDNGLEILRTAAHVDNHPGITAENLLHKIAPYHALIVRGRTKVRSQLIEAAKELKVVGRAGVGIDNIDLAAATAHHITVVNAPRATTIAVAEHAIGVMFGLARMLPRADAAMKAGLWTKKELKGIELYGKVLGILGVGNIGTAVAHRAKALGMTVLGYDPWLAPEQLSERGTEPLPLNEIYSRSDFISIHVPLGPETRGMINGQALGMMKRGVRLICNARGGVIDETALLGALETGLVSGAALDVFATEPPGLTALVAHPNVIATPHIGAQTIEAQKRASADIANEVLAALNGNNLRWKIV